MCIFCVLNYTKIEDEEKQISLITAQDDVGRRNNSTKGHLEGAVFEQDEEIAVDEGEEVALPHETVRTRFHN